MVLDLGGKEEHDGILTLFCAFLLEAESCRLSNIMMMMNKWHGRSK